jgi:hypothetical protein
VDTSGYISGGYYLSMWAFEYIKRTEAGATPWALFALAGNAVLSPTNLLL